MRGHVDVVTPEGGVEGWCWNENSPDKRVSAIIAVNGREAARIVADLYRDDLEASGIGDGRCAFKCVLPIGLLEANRSHVVTIIDVLTGGVIGEPYEFRSQHNAAFDDRLAALERRSTVLEARLKELREGGSDVAAAELFAVVGAFFARLSKDIAHGEPLTPERQLGDSIEALSKAYAPLSFRPNQNPTISVMVEAAQPFGMIYACLEAIKRAALKIDVRVTVVDTGAFDEVALLPGIVRGIRYIRTANDLVAEWMDADRDENSAFIVLLSGQTIIDENFLETLMESFAMNRQAGAVGGCELNSDGTLRHGGLCLFEDRLDDCGNTGHPNEWMDLTINYPVHALSSQAMAIRRTAWRAVRGFDRVFGDDLRAAAIDLCFRLRKAGWSVLSQPRAKVALPQQTSEAWVTPALSLSSRVGDVLSERWINASAARKFPLVFGVATFVGEGAKFQEELEAVSRLREAGFAVTYFAMAQTIAERSVTFLRNAGATIESEAAKSRMPDPVLIFSVSKDVTVPESLSRVKNAKFVAGLNELDRLLKSNFSLSTTS